MEYQKVLNLLNEANDSKFMTRKLIDYWQCYDVETEMIYNTELLKSNFWDYSNA